MPVTVTENVSWFSRLKNSFFGFLFSFVLIAAGIWLLAWNEHRTLQNFEGLAAAGRTVVDTVADRVDPTIQGKLVHVSGKVTSEQSVVDEDFGVEAPALVLKRSVQMYQWKEKEETHEREKLGGGKERVTTYRYEKVWDNEPIDSDGFRESGHSNPGRMDYRDARFQVDDAHLGAWRADETILGALSGSALTLAESGNYPSGFRLVDASMLYRGNNPSAPQIGDLRIQYTAVPAQAASLVAQADGEGFKAWTSPVGTEIYLVESGSKTAAALVASAQSTNSMVGWLLRLVGFVMLWVAFGLMLNPLRTLAAVLPFLARIVGALSGFVAFLLAAVVAVVTIAIAWLAVRPVLSVSLIAAAIAVAWLLKRYRQPAPAPAAAAPFMAPPPMGPPPGPPPPPR
ncbi:MAG: TMEM43 family protein [Xanthomonadales bacterium]|nr:TMEM43 family protein [Xanthomonadales bacterium]MCE7931019.1 hypothetical protein [Xanthomonadales bacterium PRO6]